MMKYEKISPKQLTSMLWWSYPQTADCDGIICDGSIRSGKTMSMSVGFILWSMTKFNNSDFALCGKTIESLRRNLTNPLAVWLEGIFIIKDHRAQNYLEIRYGDKFNRYYLFGGRDESSAALIQGMTLSGILFDEVALMPRSFVEQGMARCSVSGSKMWFNCNPESPMHWFYVEWILKAYEKNILHLHFTMDDNLSLDPKIKDRYEKLYTGVFYDRFIKGLWCVAEGLVYPQFNEELHTIAKGPDYGEYYISVDYGTVNPFSAGLWCVTGDKAIRIKEYYHDSRMKGYQKTDQEYYDDLCELVGDLPINCIVVDPSAASFIECVRRNCKFKVIPALNDVSDGIRTVANMLNSGRIKICSECTDSIREFKLYRWDEKRIDTDAVRKENDHSMDDIRYFCYTILRRYFGWDW